MDIIADVDRRLIPFAVKYGAQETGGRELKGLAEFCAQRRLERAYVITNDPRDFGPMTLSVQGRKTEAMKIPAPLACYWLGESEPGS